MALFHLLGSSVVGCVADSPQEQEQPGQPGQQEQVYSYYLPMRDGVKIAVDVLPPPNLPPGQKVPVLVRGTRYWRSFDLRENLPAEVLADFSTETKFAHAHNYALARIDARGSGASFGTRSQPWSRDELEDYRQVVDWLVTQPWSNGEVFSYGVSYDGNVADFIGLSGHPAVRAVSPQFSDVNPFTDIASPGGVRNDRFINTWGRSNEALDRNDFCAFLGAEGPACEELRSVIAGVNPVDGAPGDALKQAIQQHAGNFKVHEHFSRVRYSDSSFGESTLETLGIEHRLAEIEKNQTPTFALASWVDAGTAAGALRRFMNTKSPLVLHIGAWNHGGEKLMDTYLDESTTQEKGRPQQLDAMMKYFAQVSRGVENRREIHYYTLNEKKWRSTKQWPPAEVSEERWYLHRNQSLELTVQQEETQSSYAVDYAHSTGSNNRWQQQGEIVYENRQSAPVLSYRSAPLAEDTRFTGSARASVQLSSTHEDGAIYVYLESESPEGFVHYISEGMLRFEHRAHNPNPSLVYPMQPARSFRKADARPMKALERTLIEIPLLPTSVLIPRGHRLRVSFAGHDHENFQRLPQSGQPTLSFFEGGAQPAFIALPRATGPKNEPARKLVTKECLPSKNSSGPAEKSF